MHLQAYALARATSVRPDILAPAEGRVAVLCGKPFRPRYFARMTFFPDRPYSSVTSNGLTSGDCSCGGGASGGLGDYRPECTR